MRRAEAWKHVAHVNYTSLQTNYNKWRSYNYHHPAGNRNILQFSYGLLHSTYFYSTDSYYGGGHHFKFANIAKDIVRYSFDQNDSRDGKKLSKQGKAQFVTGASFLQQFIPYFLLKSLAAKSDSMQVVSDEQSITVRRNLPSGGSESYYFNAEQQLMKQLTVQGGQQTEQVFKNYTTSRWLTYASVIDNYVNGDLLTHDSIYSVTTEPLQESKLQVPAGYTIDATPVAPKTSKLSDGVYLIVNVPGGRNIMFVELKHGIFVTEAPLSPKVSQAMIDNIHTTLPAKPLKYVHVSHFHNDHTAGIRAFAAEGATIVGSDYTMRVIHTIVDDSKEKFKDKFYGMNNQANFLSLTAFNKKMGK